VITNAQVVCVDGIESVEAVVIRHTRTCRVCAVNTWHAEPHDAYVADRRRDHDGGEEEEHQERDYLGWPRRRLHSPRAERMKVTPPSPPSAQSVQTKKKPPVDLAISP